MVFYLLFKLKNVDTFTDVNVKVIKPAMRPKRAIYFECINNTCGVLLYCVLNLTAHFKALF